MSDKPPRLLARLGKSFVLCAPEAGAYGVCIKKNLQMIKKDRCAEEFKVLEGCIKNKRK